MEPKSRFTTKSTKSTKKNHVFRAQSFFVLFVLFVVNLPLSISIAAPAMHRDELSLCCSFPRYSAEGGPAGSMFFFQAAIMLDLIRTS